MNSSAVVKSFNVIKNALPSLCAALVMVVEYKFPFQCAEETFRRGIVPTVTRSAHAADHAEFAQQSLIVITGIL